jgi:cytochrome c oxidase subunit 3
MPTTTLPGTTVTEELDLTHGRNGGGGSGFGGDNGGEGASGMPAVPQRTYVTGMTVALGGILMFFMALTSAYIVRKGISFDWRPLVFPKVLWVNTAILLLSSATIARARRFFLRNDIEGFRHWWGLTTALGLLFLVGQVIAWRQLAAQGVYLTSNPSSSFFYVLTAAHGLHLLGGIVALLFVGLRWARQTHLTPATATEVVSIYWHFMDGLWVFLLLLLYLGR